jgi:hypothetical protein
MLVHIRPSPYRFARKTRSVNRLRINRFARLYVRIAPASDPPSAQSPFARDKALPSPSESGQSHLNVLDISMLNEASKVKAWVWHIGG